MMAPEGGVEIIDLTEIVGDIEIPCDYDRLFHCGPAAAKWEMRGACGCGAKGVRLVCEGCKDAVIATDDGLMCNACGVVTAPARLIFWHIQALF